MDQIVFTMAAIAATVSVVGLIITLLLITLDKIDV